jgi:hypothetical protein
MKIRVAGVLGLAAVGISRAALAADLPAGSPAYTKAPAIVAAAYDWHHPFTAPRPTTAGQV